MLKRKPSVKRRDETPLLGGNTPKEEKSHVLERKPSGFWNRWKSPQRNTAKSPRRSSRKGLKGRMDTRLIETTESSSVTEEPVQKPILKSLPTNPKYSQKRLNLLTLDPPGISESNDGADDEDEIIDFDANFEENESVEERTEAEAEETPVKTLDLQKYSGRWVVKVSSPEWDESQWKYRILIQRRNLKDSQKVQHGSFTSAYCWRSLNDWKWLHDALLEEFAGGLVLPDLTLQQNNNAPQDQALEVWLSQVLNGHRGGQLILPYASSQPTLVMESQSMERFLYHSNGPLADDNIERPESSNKSARKDNTSSWPWFDTLCGPGPQGVLDDAQLPPKVVRMAGLPAVLGCSSQALDPSSDAESSFCEPPQSDVKIRGSPEIEALADFLEGHCQLAWSCCETGQRLVQTQDQWAKAWQALAVAMYNLFAFEKSMESSKSLGKVDLMPFRRIGKKVEGKIQKLVKAKVGPGLHDLQADLASYVADLKSVGLGMEQYRRRKGQELDIRYNEKSRSWDGHTKSHVAEPSRDLSDIESLLRSSLLCLATSTRERTTKMATDYFQAEGVQASKTIQAAVGVTKALLVPRPEQVARMIDKHILEEKQDSGTELELMERLVPEVSRRSKERLGRWNSELAMAIMETVGVHDPNVRVEETTKELRIVRKHAIGLRERLNRCLEAVGALRDLPDIRGLRLEFVDKLARFFAGPLQEYSGGRKAAIPSRSVLKSMGIPLDDPMGWRTVYEEGSAISTDKVESVGKLAATYTTLRDSQTEWLVNSLSDLLHDYTERVEAVESYVYMECVGIQLEKYYSQKRTEALTTFEKRTDISSAMNVAVRKNMTDLVEELEGKLERLGPEVSLTRVKEAKLEHLKSKTLKSELHQLANRRLTRVREASTERIVAIMSMWAKEEGGFAAGELKAVKETVDALEKTSPLGDKLKHADI